MAMELANAFRVLRAAWFNAVLKVYAHERQWETEEDETARENRNDSIRRIFDQQTEAIIAGEDKNIAPTCLADMD